MKRQRPPRIDLSDVSSLTPDAIVALLCVINDDIEKYHVSVSAKLPTDPAIKEVLLESGFAEHVNIPPKSRASGTPGKLGYIAEKYSKRVEPQTARAMIWFGTKQSSGAQIKKPGTYRALIECMMNTVQHAHNPHVRKHEDWWVSVYCDPATSRVKFAFIDNGVGIFKSVMLRPYHRVLRGLGVHDNADLLRVILKGEVGSRTGLKYRGKGLPMIYQLAHAGVLKDLVMITNNVKARVNEDKYERMRRSFSGTFYAWELGE